MLTIRGRVVLESAGPDWHLVRVVKRDKLSPNQLIFSRRRDALSSKITTLGNRSLATLKLTDPSGNSVVLTNARIMGLALQQRATTQSPKHSAPASTYENENFSIRFDQISLENLASDSASDDWT